MTSIKRTIEFWWNHRWHVNCVFGIMRMIDCQENPACTPVHFTVPAAKRFWAWEVSASSSTCTDSRTAVLTQSKFCGWVSVKLLSRCVKTHIKVKFATQSSLKFFSFPNANCQGTKFSISSAFNLTRIAGLCWDNRKKQVICSLPVLCSLESKNNISFVFCLTVYFCDFENPVRDYWS